MKTQRNMLFAFLLNLAFSIFEFVGGLLTGSVAILSDALHDLGDAAGIGVSYFLERKSKKQPDENYTYGYARFSALGGLITTLILLLGSVAMIIKAADGIIHPRVIHYDGMILFAVVGVVVNLIAALLTHRGDSVNQRAVNLHMLEDVLGWAVVLIGALVMRFTDFALLDPLMSIGVSAFILIHAIRNLRDVMVLFLEKAPANVSLSEIRSKVASVKGIADVHHIHLWSLDGLNHYATMHIVTDRNAHEVKDEIRHLLAHCGIGHVTLELETTTEHCHERECHVETHHNGHCHHHHH